MAELKGIKSNIKLRNIHSSYIIKDIFSFLNNTQKLNIIMYNKEFQNILLVNIEDYKKISGIIKIGEKNGKGTEYSLYTKSLLFKGEYLNGKRNGKGTEYYENGEIIFEGEYLNGKRNGIGKDYDNGELIFEGQYLNGKRNGKGKEYDYGKLIFEGEYLNGKRNGKGKEYYDGILKFEGEYLNGKRWNGKVQEYILKYKGEYINGVFQLKEGKRFYFDPNRKFKYNNY